MLRQTQFTMPQSHNVCSYIANRIFCHVVDIPVRPHQLYEGVFFELMDYVEAFVRTQGGSEVCQQIPGNATSLDDLLIDVKEIYEGVITELGSIHSTLAVRALFVATFMLMKRYEDDTRKCAHLAFWFDVFAYRSRGWHGLVTHALRSSRDSGV